MSSPLTCRETEVLALLRQGRRRSEIAHLLGISPKTVDVYQEHIKEKLGVRRVRVFLYEQVA
ncbi:MAG TPA: helix-turn-helix transcriptional regulator [Ktedonobacteraceae bacterium]|nr:helix-turn-helix transcriptional regulator [Ktedonobacteraceae bacterium]